MSTDDIYMSSASGNQNNVNNNQNSTSNNKNMSNNAITKDGTSLWKSAESLNAFTAQYLANQSQLPTTTWPRGTADL
jgi:hypothetical protein